MIVGRILCGLGGIVGKGLLAGLAGTAAVTVSQTIEKDLTGRHPGTLPAKAVEKVFGIRAVDEEHEAKFSKAVHWAYGTCWGLFRSALGVIGVKGSRATLVHWATIWAAAATILPKLEIVPPVREWPTEMCVAQGVQHFVYAAAAGMIYDLIDEA